MKPKPAVCKPASFSLQTNSLGRVFLSRVFTRIGLLSFLLSLHCPAFMVQSCRCNCWDSPFSLSSRKNPISISTRERKKRVIRCCGQGTHPFHPAFDGTSSFFCGFFLRALVRTCAEPPKSVTLLSPPHKKNCFLSHVAAHL